MMMFNLEVYTENEKGRLSFEVVGTYFELRAGELRG